MLYHVIKRVIINAIYLVDVEDEAGQHVVAFAINVVILFLDVKLAEEVEGDDRVDVHYDSQQHDRQEQLLSVVSDGLQDGAEGSHGYGYIQQMGREEEVVEIAQNGEGEVQERVKERVVRNRHAGLPHLCKRVQMERDR